MNMYAVSIIQHTCSLIHETPDTAPTAQICAYSTNLKRVVRWGGGGGSHVSQWGKKQFRNSRVLKKQLVSST